ncbi:MAG: hypothetical protein FWD56_06900, partial [Bacteroidales bacterium]|nr:hypothetical protein [Bacteroidales bacterium]
MKRRHITTIAIAGCLFLGVTLNAQQERLDLSVAQKIKQEERQSSDVERLSYLLLDLAGPRLTGSDGMERGYKIAKQIMEEYNLHNPRVEFARPWPRGGWDVNKIYVAMTAPYYIAIPAAPVGWSGGTQSAIKGKVVLITAKTFDELYALKGTLKDKIVLMPSTQEYAISFAPFATRHTDETLKQVVDYPFRAAVRPRPDPMVRQLNYNDIL